MVTHAESGVTSERSLLDLPPDEAAAQVVADADEEWARNFVDALDRQVRRRPLERVMTLWELSPAATARLFGVSRQVFTKWLASGPPPSRATAVADVAAATDLLDRYLKRERIPAVVRRKAPALGNQSLVELAQAGRTAEVLALVREMFELRRVQP